MKVKTSELQGAALDWAVAKCENNWAFEPDGCDSYSTDWGLGGPIIEREGISLTYENGDWYAKLPGKPASYFSYHSLVSAMRCYVASKLGDEIEILEEIKA